MPRPEQMRLPVMPPRVGLRTGSYSAAPGPTGEPDQPDRRGQMQPLLSWASPAGSDVEPALARTSQAMLRPPTKKPGDATPCSAGD